MGKITFIRSDQGKGIINVTADVFPGCQQCFCVKHIEKNGENKFIGKQDVTEMQKQQIQVIRYKCGAPKSTK